MLKYIDSINPRANTKRPFHFLFSNFFLSKINHIPNAANIIYAEWNWKDWEVSSVACSETESVTVSVVVNKGKIAFRYLWEGIEIRFVESLKIINEENITSITVKINIFILILDLSGLNL